jgi:hypothetical protein
MYEDVDPNGCTSFAEEEVAAKIFLVISMTHENNGMKGIDG